jgi:hypothetical protein
MVQTIGSNDNWLLCRSRKVNLALDGRWEEAILKAIGKDGKKSNAVT